MSRLGVASGWRLRLWLAMVLFVLIGAGTEVRAATPDEVEAKYQRTLAEMLDDLGSPERSFAFVEAATEKGDFYGAIAALERILILRPALANIQMELGVLYMRVGAVSRGRTLIQRSLQSPDVPPDVRARAEQIMTVDENATAAFQGPQASPLQANVFYASLNVGGRYESNANAGPDDREVLIGGNPGLLDRESLGRSDYILSPAVSATYLRLFESRIVPRLEFNAQYISQFYDHFDNLDFGGVGVDAGPWIRLSPNSNRFEVRPFVSYANYHLDHHKFVEIKGAGVALQSGLTDKDQFGLSISDQDQAYDNSPDRFVVDRNGDYLTLASQYTRQLAPNQYLSLQLSGETADADEDFQSYDRFGVGLAYRLFFDGWIGRGKNTLNVAARTRRTKYDEPDPQFGPGRREEDRYEFGLDWTVPVLEHVSLTGSVQQAINDSNIANTDYDNTSAGLVMEARY